MLNRTPRLFHPEQWDLMEGGDPDFDLAKIRVSGGEYSLMPMSDGQVLVVEYADGPYVVPVVVCDPLPYHQALVHIADEIARESEIDEIQKLLVGDPWSR